MVAIRHVGLRVLVFAVAVSGPWPALPSPPLAQAGPQSDRGARLQAEMARDCRGLVDRLAGQAQTLRDTIRNAERDLSLAQAAEATLRAKYNTIRDTLAGLRSGIDAPSAREVALKRRMDDLQTALDAFNSSVRSRQMHQDDLDWLTSNGLLASGGFPGGRTPERLREMIASLTRKIETWRQTHGSPEQVMSQLLELADLMAAAASDRRGPDGFAQHRELLRAEKRAEADLWSAVEERRGLQDTLAGLNAELAAVETARTAAETCTTSAPPAPAPSPATPADAGWGGNYFGDYEIVCPLNGERPLTGKLGFSLHVDSMRFFSMTFQGISDGFSGLVDRDGRLAAERTNVKAKGMSNRIDGDRLTLSFSGRFVRESDGRQGVRGQLALGDGAGLNCTGTWQTR